MKNIKLASASIMLLVIISSIPIASFSLLLAVQRAAAQVTTPFSDKIHILKAGVRAYNSAAEFGPITVGAASTTKSGSSTVIRAIPVDVLHYNDPNSFAPNASKLVTAGMNVTLKNQSLLSNVIQKKGISYIEDTFRTLNISNPKDNHNGILWYDGFKTYYAFLRPDRVVIFTPDKGEIAYAPAAHNIGKWDTLKVVYRDGFIDVFLNNAFKIQIKHSITPTNTTSNQIKHSITPTNTTSNQESQCYSSLYIPRACG
jgi:hypothetical protein